MVFSGDIYSLTVGVVETKPSDNKRQQTTTNDNKRHPMQLKKFTLRDVELFENDKE